MIIEVSNDYDVFRELKRVGKAVSALLATAADEKRITCGLRPAIKVLEMDPAQILFCVMPHTNDAAKHIQSVLLEAFCYEHNIAIIKVCKLRWLTKPTDKARGRPISFLC